MNNDIDAVLDYYKWKIIKRFDSLFAYDVSDDERELYIDALTEIESDIKALVSKSPTEQVEVIKEIVEYVLKWQNIDLK